jgi:hypothetical protein
MPMQQMALMHYKAPPAGGGGDSAYLENVALVLPAITSAQVIFNTASGNIEYIEDSSIKNTYTWKTGTGALTDYDAKYIETVATGPVSLAGSAVNAWITMALNTPSWSLGAGATDSVSSGYLLIRNNLSLQELANVTLEIRTNAFA